MKQEEKKPEKEMRSNFGMVAAVAMLVVVIGVGVYENSGAILGDSIHTNLLQGEVATEEGNDSTESETEDDDETEVLGEKIEVEIVPQNE